MQQTDIECIGFIMDGNRRWAKANGKSSLEGHRKGAEVFFDSMSWVRDSGIPHAVYYAFSTENWQRNEEEVGYLLDLFREVLQKIEKDIDAGKHKSERTTVRAIGQTTDFPIDIQEQIERLEKKSLQQEDAITTIWIALSYGGRAEIVEAVNKAVRAGKEVNEETFGQALWTAEMPDPDVIVRTGGEHRLSNFMTWGSVYSELIFLDTPWPALTKNDFEDILKEYAGRERRRGA